jgi:hypothetical protein
VILVAIEVALVIATCLVVLPKAIVMLATIIDVHRVELPVARLLRKRKTGRRFQRPVYQRVS